MKEEPKKKKKLTLQQLRAAETANDEEVARKVVDFEGDSAQDVEVMEKRSSISKFLIVQSSEGDILDRQDLHNLHRLVIEYYEHIPPIGLGLILHGDLTTMMETTEESDVELWRNQTEWEIIRWRLYESTGLMQRMLEHKLEVQRETEDALNLIRFVMKQKEDLEREEE
ncbi:hypothetical protein Tco_1321575 [Tanacetum coccineum]